MDHWALQGCCLHRTSCPGIAAHNNHESSVLHLLAVYGTTCTAPLAYTENICTKDMVIWLISWGYNKMSAGLMSDITFSHIFYHVFAETIIIPMHNNYAFILFAWQASPPKILSGLQNSFVMGISKQWSKTKRCRHLSIIHSALSCENPEKGHSRVTESIR